MLEITVEVNGKPVTAHVDDSALVVEFLRDSLGLTGTHIGCDTSQCGACVVLINGVSVKSCTMLAVQLDGKRVTTIEGIAANELHPMQAAFHEHHGLQCGFCTPGMVLTALALVQENQKPTEDEIRDFLEGNLCRCTGYDGIVKSVIAGAEAMRKTGLKTFTGDPENANF
jgi:carbon-monoxide dehydrogenase small subunit